MDLTELSALTGQTLTPEQVTEGIAAISTALPKLHTEIRQDGYRAGLSMTKLEYEKEDKSGRLDKALAEIETHASTIAERDERIKQLADANPDHARQLLEKDLQLETLTEKHSQALERVNSDLKSAQATTEDLRITGFKADLRRALDDLHLNPDPAELATYKLDGRYKRENGGWSVYEEVVKDGTKVLSPILVEANQTPAQALAASYAHDLPKGAYKEMRNLGPESDYGGEGGGSKTMKMSDLSVKSVGEQTKIGQQVAKGELELRDD